MRASQAPILFDERQRLTPARSPSKPSMHFTNSCAFQSQMPMYYNRIRPC